MLLYEGDWVQNGNMYYFEGCQGKGIEPKKTTTYEELLKIETTLDSPCLYPYFTYAPL